MDCETALREMQAGRYCSECNRSASEIERRGERFENHLASVGGKPVPATQQELNERSTRCNKDISDVVAQINQIKLRDDQLRFDASLAAEAINTQRNEEQSRRREDHARRQSELREQRAREAQRAIEKVAEQYNTNQRAIDDLARKAASILNKPSSSASSDQEPEAANEEVFEEAPAVRIEIAAATPTYSVADVDFTAWHQSTVQTLEANRAAKAAPAPQPVTQHNAVASGFSSYPASDNDSAPRISTMRDRLRRAVESGWTSVTTTVHEHSEPFVQSARDMRDALRTPIYEFVRGSASKAANAFVQGKSWTPSGVSIDQAKSTGEDMAFDAMVNVVDRARAQRVYGANIDELSPLDRADNSYATKSLKLIRSYAKDLNPFNAGRSVVKTTDGMFGPVLDDVSDKK